VTRASSSKTFSYSTRHRWAYLPSLGFLVVILVILLTDPGLIWTNADPTTLRAATLLAAALAFGFAAAIAARWVAPFWFAVEGDALVARPLLGAPRRVRYSEITDVRVLPKTFMRGVPEVVLQTAQGRPIAIRTDIGHYDQLERALSRHLAPDLQARWKEARAG
jgi:hypothetical protein